MKKLKLLAVVLAFGSLNAMAKANLKKSHVNLITQNELQEDVRVYLNKKLVTYYTLGSGSDIDSDSGDISLRTVTENLEVKVSKKVRGLITGIEDYNDRIYVSFDSDCFVKSCSYRFDMRNGKYDLSDVPALNGYNLVTAKSGSIIKGRPLKKERIHLEVNADSLNIINTQKVNSQGH